MSDEGLTIAQAAEALGVSPKTIRRHIKDGKIHHVVVQGKYGPEYRIPELPNTLQREPSDDVSTEESPGMEESTQGGSSTITITPTLAMDIITDLQKTNLQLAGQLGAAQERIHELEGQLRLLTAPKRPWWRRVLKVLSG